MQQYTPKVDPLISCLRGESTHPILLVSVAYVIPTFTLTPYVNFNSSFYAFYQKYAKTSGPITTDLAWLQTPVTNAWSLPKYNNEKPLYDFLSSASASRCGLVAGRNLHFIDDIAVNSGALFSGSSRKYDAVIIGHEEYVTPFEYGQFQSFVHSGGRLISMSGNTFWAEVSYSGGIETFVVGHGFEFDGTVAMASPTVPFGISGWFGSAFCLSCTASFTHADLNLTSPFGTRMGKAFNASETFTDYNYPHNEVNYVTNRTSTSVIALFQPYTGISIDAYAHRYGKGNVLDIGVFGLNLLANGDVAAEFFALMPLLPLPSPYLPIPGPSISVVPGGGKTVAMVAFGKMPFPE